MKHTPAPWTSKRSNNSSDVGILADGGCIAEFFAQIRTADEHALAEQKANVALTCAAPRLFEAAKQARLALAGYASAHSAIEMLDPVLGDLYND